MKLTWKTMSAREKDAAVAMHVFKATHIRELRGDLSVARFNGFNGVIPNYTTDPAALAEVKERFGDWESRRVLGQVIHVSIYRYGKHYEASAPTEAEAFAIASLRAHGIEVEI